MQQAEAQVKCRLTLEIAQFTATFTCCDQFNRYPDGESVARISGSAGS